MADFSLMMLTSGRMPHPENPWVPRFMGIKVAYGSTSGPVIRSVDQLCGVDLMRLQPVIIFLIQVCRSRTSAVEEQLYPNWPITEENVDFVQFQYSHNYSAHVQGESVLKEANSDDHLGASHGREHEIGFAAGAVRASSVPSPAESCCLTALNGGARFFLFFLPGKVSLLVFVSPVGTRFLNRAPDRTPPRVRLLFEVVESAQQPGDSRPSQDE